MSSETLCTGCGATVTKSGRPWLLTFTLNPSVPSTYVLPPDVFVLVRFMRLAAQNGKQCQYEAVIEHEDNAILVEAKLNRDPRILHFCLTSSLPDWAVNSLLDYGSFLQAKLSPVSLPPVAIKPEVAPLKLDTSEQVFFYEQEFYVLSNFSAFSLIWKYLKFNTSEAAYHFEKFPHRADIKRRIYHASSAHEAYKIAECHKASRRHDWDDVKVQIMEEILRAKVSQHEYVRRKLLETGNRELIENSWRDDYWGWGADRKGQNQLGKLWMKIRKSLAEAVQA